jgi:4,5-dihydroxyphthalate decarboxylase
MVRPQLTAVSRTQGANRALKDGSITPAHWDLDFVEVPVLVDAFRRMVRRLEFDVSEMAITTYLSAKAHGVAFTALPIFLVRAFHHGAIAVNTNAGIGHPKDLEGRRVGVSRGYTVTTGVWARGILQDEYGVDLDAVTWVLSGDEHVTQYRPPANVVPMPPGAKLADLLASGDLAAGVGGEFDHPDIAPLIPDADEAGFAALAQRGHYPINHLIVVRNELLAAHPDIAVDVFDAFTAAKDRYVERLRAGEGDTPQDVMLRRVIEITDADPLPYGIEPNRRAIDELIRHAMNQHIIDEPPVVDSLFAETVREVVG